MKFSSVALVLLLTAGLVIAYGTSTGYTPPAQNPAQPSPQAAQTAPQPSPQAAPFAGQSQCENLTTVKERVQCRLEQNVTGNGPEESCRGLANVAACQALYDDSQQCYNMTGTDKDKCFKHTAGITTAALAGQSQQSIRNYVVLLLYDLQDRVEASYNAGAITSSQAADIIDSIVQAKQDVLEAKNQGLVRAAVNVVKQKYMAVLG